jgi:hypothetical protein
LTPHRIMLRRIDHAWMFYILATLATGFFLAGLGAYIRVWRKSGKSPQISFSGDALKKMILDAIMGRRVLQGHVAAGLMHLFIFWGGLIFFVGTCLWAVHHYLAPFLEGYGPSGLFRDHGVGGLMLLATIIWT